jgi:hypothetical protein
MLSTLTILSLDQGKIYTAPRSSQFDEHALAETCINPCGMPIAEDEAAGPQAVPLRATTGFVHFLGWLAVIIALRRIV